MASRASIGIAAGAAGITGRSVGCPSLKSDTGLLSWLSVSVGCPTVRPASICGCLSSSESDQGIALCWLSQLASDRRLRAYLSFVVIDTRQCNDKAGWLLLALAAHEFRAWSQRYLCR